MTYPIIIGQRKGKISCNVEINSLKYSFNGFENFSRFECGKSYLV